MTINDEDVVTMYRINMKANDGTIHSNFSTCQPSFSAISVTSVNTTFRCIPELDARGSWSMILGVYGTYDSDAPNEVGFYELSEKRKSEYFNLTLERGDIAKANVVGSTEIMEKMGDFLFLDSSIDFRSNGIIDSTLFSTVHDVSQTNTDGEFRFVKFPPNLNVLDGEAFTIVCLAIGRNPPPITVYKDGGSIRESEEVILLQITSRLWSWSYVTFRHASKESAGNYSCVAENNGNQLVSQRYTEVELGPRHQLYLTKSLENEQNLVSCV
jgi:hypothetical protein